MLMLDGRNIRQGNSSTPTCLYNRQAPISGVLTSSTVTQTRQGRSLNKYQRCSQSVLMVVRCGNGEACR